MSKIIREKTTHNLIDAKLSINLTEEKDQGSLFFFWFLRQGFQVSLSYPENCFVIRLASNSEIPCLCLLSTRIKSVSHHWWARVHPQCYLPHLTYLIQSGQPYFMLLMCIHFIFGHQAFSIPFLQQTIQPRVLQFVFSC